MDTLLDAWSGFRFRGDFDLVIAGASGWAGEKTLARLASRPPGVRYLGYVPEDELPGLMAGASAFVYPSLYEGFGFPVAQAMAAGVPVITSNTSCLPEVAGEGALLVDPRSAGGNSSGDGEAADVAGFAATVAHGRSGAGEARVSMGHLRAEKLGIFPARLRAYNPDMRIWICVLCSMALAWAGDAAPPDQIRDAATRAITLFQASQKGWYSTQTCNSCHHQFQAALAFQSAREHGIPVDEKIAHADAVNV